MPCGWNPLEFSGGEENWRAQDTQVFRFDHHCTWLGFFFSGLASRALRCPKKGWIVEVDFVVSSSYVSYVCMNGTLLQLLSSLSGIGKISLRWMLTYQWRQSFGVTYVWLCGKCGRKEQIKCFHIKRGLLHLFSRVDCRCSFHKIGLSVYLLDMNIYIYIANSYICLFIAWKRMTTTPHSFVTGNCVGLGNYRASFTWAKGSDLMERGWDFCHIVISFCPFCYTHNWSQYMNWDSEESTSLYHMLFWLGPIRFWMQIDWSFRATNQLKRDSGNVKRLYNDISMAWDKSHFAVTLDPNPLK